MSPLKISSNAESSVVDRLIAANFVAVRRLSESPSILSANTFALRSSLLHHFATISQTLNSAVTKQGLPTEIKIEEANAFGESAITDARDTFPKVVRLRGSDSGLIHRNRAACIGALYMAHGIILCLKCDARDLEEGRGHEVTQNLLFDLPIKALSVPQAKGLNLVFREIERTDTDQSKMMIKGSQWAIGEFSASLAAVGDGDGAMGHQDLERRASQ